jgi:L-aspartate oxidase
MMFPSLLQRRYLIPFKAGQLPQQTADVLVIGGGVAGLRAAIAASETADVLLVTKDSVEQSNTWYAQGGIAAVLQPLDSYEMHVSDTESAGAGLCDDRAVQIVIKEGPQRVLELLSWGANFDKQQGNPYDLAFAREGGHSFARIVHAYGDATGKDVAQTLINAVRTHKNIRVSERSFVIDLITDNGRCVGALALINHQVTIIWARQTILASGGAGQLYRESTNPRIATADGHAMAWRAGATLQDMEMVQFHPTTLYVAGSSRALITEAVRGEGAYLVDRNGQRFMKDYHPDGELAPRDIVSLAIVQQIRRTRFTHVYLDVRHLEAQKFRSRFPQLAHLLDQFEINPAKDLIPIHPAAHYMIGGVDADEFGQSSLKGLYTVGEASCSGLHGANRLGSNSLLEGLAFGARAGKHAADSAHAESIKFPHSLEHRIPPSTRTELDITDVKSSLRSIMWRNVGIERGGEGLAETLERLAYWGRYVMDKVFDPQSAANGVTAGWELQNMLSVCALITTAAHARKESRGVHFRLDFPKRDDANWRVHLLWRRPQETPAAEPVETANEPSRR